MSLRGKLIPLYNPSGFLVNQMRELREKKGHRDTHVQIAASLGFDLWCDPDYEKQALSALESWLK